MKPLFRQFFALLVVSCVHLAAAVVSINQDRAIAGGVTPGDSPGFPVTISEPGSYKLSGNLTVPDADTTAIQIFADGVTLDLNGFSIIGPVVCTNSPASCSGSGKGLGVDGRGDQIPGQRGVRVINGSIHGMGLQGMLLPGVGSSAENITVDSNAGGGMSVAGRVIQCAATRNGSFGIIAAIVRDSSSEQNAGDGILLDPSGGVATGNISTLNGGVGMIGGFSTFTGNTVFLNRLVGISATCPSSVIGNTITANNQSGTIETRGSGCVLANNATRE